MHYWDTSALAKLYVSEPDSALFSAHVSATGAVTSSELTRWEIFRVLERKELERQIPPGAADAIFKRFLADLAAGSVALIPMSPAVEERFRRLVPQLHRLTPPLITRTLDGIHLATADLHRAAEVVATDANFRKCAVALGLKVFPN